MDFENYTPFPALAYDIVDPRDEECHVVVARGTYELGAAPSGVGERGGAVPAVTLVAVTSGEQAGISVKDEYFGEVNRTSVHYESDLAPGKPRCDVIVVGSAHSPSGGPVTRVEIGIRIQRVTAVPPFAEVGTRLEHRLIVHGPRSFVRRRAVVGSGWRLSEPEPFLAQPLRYEHAFGGELKVYPRDAAAQRLRDEHRLSDEARARHPEAERAPLAHTTCLHNPLGVGWLEEWYADAASIDTWPAPQIEAPGAPMTAEIFDRMLRGKSRAADLATLTPQGVGVVAKPWQPRLARAGTLDERWLAERWPAMPHDYDLAYWNGAHPSMQCDHLFGGEVVELWNLLPRSTPGVVATGDGSTVCRFRLPDPALAAHLKRGDVVLWGVPRIDTLIIDLEKMRLAMVWRLLTPASMGIEGLSLRTFGDDPGAA
jgi:hypothetical protein